MGKKSKKPSKQAPKPKAAAAAGPTAVPIESAQIYSAHKTIAVYQGTEDGVATFGVATYLRYAKADASKAEEPRHDLSLPLAEADAHTALLSESAEGAISSVVASLAVGDRVELEWLQMRLPSWKHLQLYQVATMSCPLHDPCSKKWVWPPKVWIHSLK